MDIKQAKQELRQTLRAYTDKTEAGVYRIFRSQQRPVLLMGPPGIGKTAVIRQIAQEEDVGFVSYSMTHHTRQSALGLPVIVEHTAAGERYRATEYTMSEILASVYEQMEKTGVWKGILFLDEINCVSETLMPAILQMLQSKTFGVHALPEGWMIAAAGNPPRFNQSARGFDMATLDRVRLIELSPDPDVWQDYAGASGVHPAVRAYLRLHPEHFFVCDARISGQFVTARGWEDLSSLLLSYEALGFSCEQTQVQEYLHVPEISAAFAAFYALFRRFSDTLPLEEILSGSSCEQAQPLRTLPFEGRLSVAEFLLHSLRRRTLDAQQAAALAFSAESFFGSIPQTAQTAAFARGLLEKRRAALRIRKECGVLPAQEEQRETAFLTRAEAVVSKAQSDGECADALRTFSLDAQRAAQVQKDEAVQALENGLRFLIDTFGADQELWIVLHGLKTFGADSLLQKENSSLYRKLLSEATPEARAAALRRTLTQAD